MIISNRNKFVFVAIPKTGTHSVRRALRKHTGPDDMEQVVLFETRTLPFPELAKLGHGHISLEQLRPFLDPATFDNYFKFAFVRNPFDRFVSYCAFMTRDRPDFQVNPTRVMRHILFTIRPMKHILFQPQSSFIISPDGKLLTDYVGRFEDMQSSFDEICDRIGIGRETLERSNTSSRGDFRQYYDQELKETVAKLYARDLELFGYDF